MNYPKITIVTASYNQGEFLERTINSILKQNYPNLEYIIMDGGSTDGSVDIIKKYESGITFWESKKDHGQSDAINQGLKKASGEIVGWLNSDDMLADGALHTIAEAFSDSSVKMIFSPIDMIDADDKLIGISDRKLMDFTAMLFGSQLVNQEGIFWRNKLHERVGYLDESLHFAMDYDFFLRCCMQCKPVYVNKVLGRHRRHKNQKTHFADSYRKEMMELRELYRRTLGISKLSFNVVGYLQRRKKAMKIYGWKKLFMTEWMDKQ